MINANSKQMTALDKLLSKHDKAVDSRLCAYICKQDAKTGIVTAYRTNGHYFLRFEISNFGLEFTGSKAFSYNRELGQFVEYTEESVNFETCERVHPAYDKCKSVDYYIHFNPSYMLLGQKIFEILYNHKDLKNPILYQRPKTLDKEHKLGPKLWARLNTIFGLMPLRATED